VSDTEALGRRVDDLVLFWVSRYDYPTMFNGLTGSIMALLADLGASTAGNELRAKIEALEAENKALRKEIGTWRNGQRSLEEEARTAFQRGRTDMAQYLARMYDAALNDKPTSGIKP
jgi:hypothetical protein